MTVKTPGTPASKIDRTPVSTPTSKMDRTPVSTPGGPRAKEEKIVVTVRLRPLSKREQLAKDQVAWECIDDTTIVYKPPPQERSAQPAPFTFGKEKPLCFFFIIFSFLMMAHVCLLFIGFFCLQIRFLVLLA